MGRNVGPACRICRREMMKLFLKGERCYMAKCPVETGRPPPGMHGANRRGKPSDYAIQLREKQKLKSIFGMRESQFWVFFKRALKKRGITGEMLLQALELRLDNLVYRLGFATSRRAARQFVRHGHIFVNDKRANVPSMVLREGDVIKVKDRAKGREFAKQGLEKSANRPIAAWLVLDKGNLTGKIDHVPTREEIAPSVNEQLVVELYSR